MVAFLVDTPGAFFNHHHMTEFHPTSLPTYSSGIEVRFFGVSKNPEFFYFLSMKPKLKFSANGSPGIMFFTASLNLE